MFLNPSEPTETLNASNTIHDDDDVLPLGQMLQKVGESFLRKLRRFKTCMLAKNPSFKVKKDKIGDDGASASTELPLGQLLEKELMKRTSEHLRNKGHKRAREDDESYMDHKDDEKDDDITIAQIMIKSRRDDKSGSKAKKNMVQRPSNENNSSDPLIDSNGGITDIIVSPPETKQTCDGELHVNGTKEEKCLVHEDGENQRCNENLCSEAEKEEDIDGRLKQRKLAIEEMALKLEARI